MASWTYTGQPSGEWIRGGEPESEQAHRACCLPDRASGKSGSVWRCECGRRWKINGDGCWARRWLPWPRGSKKAKQMKQAAKELKKDLKELEKL